MPAGYESDFTTIVYWAAEIPWAAGFFDGEGTVCTFNDERQRRITVAVSQAGEYAEEILERFQRAVGNIGKIYKHNRPQKPHWKLQYSWRVSSKKDVWQVYCTLYPFLSGYKKEQFEKCFNKYSDWKSNAIEMTSERGRQMAEMRWKENSTGI